MRIKSKTDDLLNAHCLPVSDVLSKLGVNQQKGLDSNTVRQRISEYGHNLISEAKVTSPFKLFLSQFNDFLIIILIIAALVSGILLHEIADTIAISAILIINAVLGFVQEFRAEHALAALKQMLAPNAKVMRQGFEQILPASEIVPGDIITIDTGDRISADARIIESKLLAIDESSLTGESVPVEKTDKVLTKVDLPIADRINMCYTGTMVTRGRGKAIVVNTGMNTEMGKIVELIDQPKEKTPLQHELKKMGEKIAYLCLGVSVIVLISGILKQHSWAEMFLIAISLAVAAIPEGLPAAVTVALSLGVKRMAEKNAIIRRLHAVETLGSTSIICTDKTGTLTMNQMRVERIALADKVYTATDALHNHAHFHELFLTATLCNDAHKDIKGRMIGDPTEIGLMVAAQEFGINPDKILAEHPRIAEIPFDSERKAMSTIHPAPISTSIFDVAQSTNIIQQPFENRGGVHREHDGYRVFVKGAPENVLLMCSNVAGTKWHEINNNLTREGFRTLAFAMKNITNLPAQINENTIEQGLTFIGIIGMSDPPRDEVAQAMNTCKQAGIKVAMITGDHKLTAENIGRRIGLLTDGKVITGQELEAMSDEQFGLEVESIQVYARVSPLQKVKIVKALKERDHIVSMTGDGVNDAPALKMADIGVAMGITGTDVAKEASDMVLIDDNFTTIVTATREGRNIFDNLKKFVLYLLSCNISEVMTMLILMLANLPILFPIQILWINLITDGLPALALGVDPAQADLMQRPPRKPSDGVLTSKNLMRVFWQGLALTVIAVSATLISYYVFKADAAQVRTVTFAALVLLQILHSFNFRVGNNFYFSKSLFRNQYLNGAFLVSIVLQAVVIFIRPINGVFKTAPLQINSILMLTILCIVGILIINTWNRLAGRKH